mmetsp:Transcript_1274/g.2762  ORF Transcript_1274/g.2762 Transcript_1274/m.2762 type:complete len:221 (+) Transcript_1274:231-893(+)
MPDAQGHDVRDRDSVSTLLEDDEVCVASFGDLSFPVVNLEQRRPVARERRKDCFQRKAFAPVGGTQQLVNRNQQVRRRPVPQPQQVPLLVEGGNASSGIGAAGDLVLRKLPVVCDVLPDGFSSCWSSPTSLLPRAGGDVDGRTEGGQLHRLLQKRKVPVAVRWIEDPRRDFCLLQRPLHHLHSPLAGAHVQMESPRLARHQMRNMAVTRDPHELVEGWLA